MQQFLPMFYNHLDAQTPKPTVIILSKPLLITTHQVLPPARKPLLDQVGTLCRFVRALVEDVRDIMIRLCEELSQARAEELVEELVKGGC